VRRWPAAGAPQNTCSVPSIAGRRLEVWIDWDVDLARATRGDPVSHAASLGRSIMAEGCCGAARPPPS